MDIVYLISQIIGFIAFIISLVAYHRKKKEKILRTMMLSNLLDITHYLLLGAYSGCITKIMGIVRNETIILKEKYKVFNNVVFLIILLTVYLIAGILTYEHIFSVLPILAATIYLYVIWNGNELKVKKIAFFCYFLWLIYNTCVFSIAGIVSNIVSIISTFIAVYNENKNNIKRTNN